MPSKTALILVDLQNDFCPGGGMAVPGGDELAHRANRLMSGFDVVVATQDWHPGDHGSFAVNHPGSSPGQVIDLHGLSQVLWPAHCIQGTQGAELVADLNATAIDRVFQKGADRTVDSYSGFFDNGHKNPTGLGAYLTEQGVKDVYVCGLATDYCVKFTALDAASAGFNTHLIVDVCRGVELAPGDVDRAVAEMEQAGVRIVDSDTLAAETEPRVLFQGDYLRVCETHSWEYVQRSGTTGVVAILAVTDEAKLVLIEQFRVPVGSRVIEVPAGLSGDIAGQEQEPLETAARRELLEETGYEASTMTFLMEGPISAGLSDESITLFAAQGLTRTGPGGGDASEDIMVHEVPVAEAADFLAAKMADGVQVDPKVFAVLYFATAGRG